LTYFLQKLTHSSLEEYLHVYEAWLKIGLGLLFVEHEQTNTQTVLTNLLVEMLMPWL